MESEVVKKEAANPNIVGKSPIIERSPLSMSRKKSLGLTLTKEEVNNKMKISPKKEGGGKKKEKKKEVVVLKKEKISLINEKKQAGGEKEKGHRGSGKKSYHMTKSILGFVFSSEHDSGNMGKVSLVRCSPSDNYFEFEIFSRRDCSGTKFENKNRTWFSFSVSGGQVGVKFKICIKDLNYHPKLYAEGMKPVISIDGKSKNLMTPIRFDGKGDFSITFEYFFSSNKKILFSFSFPYSVGKCTQFLDSISSHASRMKKQKIYFHRDVLVKSFQDRNVELLTISSTENQISSKFDYSTIESCEEGSKDRIMFPNGNRRSARFKKKKCIFVSARVHSGETPSSYILEGLINFLLHKSDPRAELLRKHFVFKIIPILNPDGVYEGFYRTDTQGVNLNRCYEHPSKQNHPQIYAAMQYLQFLKKHENLTMYLDLHGHACKRGCFIYGNSYDNFEEQVENVLFSKLVSLNTQHFDFEGCWFKSNNFVKKDNLGKSKEGTGRVQVHRKTGVYCYTIECNYNTGFKVNKLIDFPKNGKKPSSFDKSLRYYFPNEKLPKYTPVIMRDIGKGVGLGVLDFMCFPKNRYSRVRSGFKTLDVLRAHLWDEIKMKKRFWKYCKTKKDLLKKSSELASGKPRKRKRRTRSFDGSKMKVLQKKKAAGSPKMKKDSEGDSIGVVEKLESDQEKKKPVLAPLKISKIEGKEKKRDAKGEKVTEGTTSVSKKKKDVSKSKRRSLPSLFKRLLQPIQMTETLTERVRRQNMKIKRKKRRVFNIPKPIYTKRQERKDKVYLKEWLSSVIGFVEKKHRLFAKRAARKKKLLAKKEKTKGELFEHPKRVEEIPKNLGRKKSRKNGKKNKKEKPGKTKNGKSGHSNVKIIPKKEKGTKNGKGGHVKVPKKEKATKEETVKSPKGKKNVKKGSHNGKKKKKTININHKSEFRTEIVFEEDSNEGSKVPKPKLRKKGNSKSKSKEKMKRKRNAKSTGITPKKPSKAVSARDDSFLFERKEKKHVKILYVKSKTKKSGKEKSKKKKRRKKESADNIWDKLHSPFSQKRNRRCKQRKMNKLNTSCDILIAT